MREGGSSQRARRAARAEAPLAIGGVGQPQKLHFEHYPATRIAARIAPMRHWLTFSTTAVFAVAALLGQSDLPAGSQPAEPTEAWCRAHNSDPSAVSHCIEAEKRLLPKTVQKPPARPLPLPQPRPQAAPTVTAEPVQQTFDKGVQE